MFLFQIETCNICYHQCNFYDVNWGRKSSIAQENRYWHIGPKNLYRSITSGHWRLNPLGCETNTLTPRILCPNNVVQYSISRGFLKSITFRWHLTTLVSSLRIWKSSLRPDIVIGDPDPGLPTNIPPTPDCSTTGHREHNVFYNTADTYYIPLLSTVGLIWYPAVPLCYSRTSGGDGTEPGLETRKWKGAKFCLDSCFITEIFYRRETNLCELMKLSEGDFKGIATGASLTVLIWNLAAWAQIIYLWTAFLNANAIHPPTCRW